VLTETMRIWPSALMLATARRVAEGDRFVRAGRCVCWTPRLMLGRDVWGATARHHRWARSGRPLRDARTSFGMRVLYPRVPKLAREPRRDSRRRIPPWLPHRRPAARALFAAVEVNGLAHRAPSPFDLARLLAEADFISLNVPLTPEHPPLTPPRIAAMKRGAILVNTARGAGD